MAIADDFAVSNAKAITYTGAAHTVTGAGYYTVIEFHRWLQDIADDAAPATANDLLSIISDTPSARSTDNIITLINGYNIDTTVSEHLYDGTIVQGDAGVDQIIWDGQVVIANPDMDLQIFQDGAQIANDFWNTIMFNDGGINPNGYKGLNRDQNNGISHRFMFKVHDFAVDGGDIDGRRYIGMTRVDFSTDGAAGKTFSEFKVNGSARGNNVMALTYADDLNDTETAAGFGTITNIKEGYSSIDVDANTVDEFYYSEWNRDTYTINQFYERMKYLARGESGNVGTLYGLDAKIFRGITHEVAVSGGAGTWVEPESLSWGTGATAGTGQLLAVDNTAGASATKIWMQILTGVIPAANTITGNGAATGTAGTVTERTVSTPFIGASTGSALIGGYGVGLEASDLGPSDTVFDLDNVSHTAPTNVTFSVGGVVSGEDRVLVGPDTGPGNGILATGQFALATAALTTVSTTINAVVGTGTGAETPGTGTQSESDTPNSGTLRVEDDNGIYQRVTYDAYTVGAGTMQFTGCDCQELSAGAAITNDIFIGYIDDLATIYTVKTLMSSATQTTCDVAPDIDAGVAATGTLRIARDDNTVTEIAYSAKLDADTFTITSTDFSTVNSSVGNNVHVKDDSVATTEAYTATYGAADRDLFIRVRDGGTEGDATGIKTFETSATISNASTSVTAIRTTDA